MADGQQQQQPQAQGMEVPTPIQQSQADWLSLADAAANIPNTMYVSSSRAGYKKWRKICFKAYNNRATFTEAAATCRQDGGTLAMPRDAETNAYLTSVHKAMAVYSGFWIGLSDQNEEGVFEWVDGTALGEYSSWVPGEPNEYGEHKDCVLHMGRGTWNDEPCRIPARFICEVIPGAYY
ncbi:PREDICTED: collectin-10-like [Branchiostoma belcheri]|uniref:Collectin-10-like n=1 Tax=Branchiostoma belcheri TaxID=7741 RepID=A0A6P5AEZ5_BRABE|nr:PREDICTED: collectin-10-like [Branchiostoma belcheri]